VSDIAVPIMTVLSLNSAAFIWLAKTLWSIDRRLVALETLAAFKGSKHA
jgi:hypothetical protein